MIEIHITRSGSGYQGHDSMRQNAERLLRGDADTDSSPAPKSRSPKEFRRPFARGGKVNKYASGGAISMATGGAIPMATGGETPVNFTELGSAMLGKRPSASNAIALKKGGCAHKGDSPKSHKRDAHRSKFAAGGVAKIRHGVMTPAGKPIKTKGPRPLRETF